MKKLITSALTLALCAALTIPAMAHDYEFSTGTDNTFGTATSYDGPVPPDPMSENTRRNKDASALPPPYFYGSGDIPTDQSSLYHDNTQSGGFVSVDQDLPPTGSEDYAPGISTVTVSAATQITAPQYYADGSIGTIYIARTGKTIKVYEGETQANLQKGAGHFSQTSAWDGNVALAGHNRGSYPYFSFVKDMQIGDKVTYTTKYGSRTYQVFSKDRIGEYDHSKLAWSTDNLLTLITCIENTPELRWAVQLREVR